MAVDRVAEAAHAEEHEVHRDYTGSKIGMWLFLFSECMLFGGLFIMYAMYRADYTQSFLAGGKEMNTAIGVFNTIVLLTGSWTVAMSITAVQRRHKKLAIGLISTTIGLGALFMVLKLFEWGQHIKHGLYPASSELAGHHGKQVFFALYYLMTGLHGLHVIAGMTVLTVMLILLIRNKITPEHSVALENAALYWHLVDIIWIFLLPLFYLAA
ncbi:MAG: cytochrome c oxidase subunit 3 family protein [Acidobacteriota bacterium]